MLHEDQKKAFNNILEWFEESNKASRVLIGYGGSGKTFLIKHIVNDLLFDSRPVYLIAPTHKACAVLAEKTGMHVQTLHSILNLSPGVELENFNPNNPEFRPYKTPTISRKGLFILDECSFVNSALKEYLEEVCEAVQTKILYVGDSYQIPPIGEDISETFLIDGDKLETIKRTDSDSILNASIYIRKNIKQNTIDLTQFIDNDRFKHVPYEEFRNLIPELYAKSLDTRYLAYTNSRVDSVNNRIRSIIKGSNIDLFEVGDIITPYKTGNKLDYRKDRSHVSMINDGYMNSEDLIIKHIESGKFYYTNNLSFECYNITCKNTNNKTCVLKVLKEESYTHFINFWHKKVSEAYDSYGKERSKIWSYLLSITSNLLLPTNLYKGKSKAYRSIGYGYATTVHKAQGSGFNNVIIDLPDIYKCSDVWLRNRLLYVAVSRAINNVILIS